MTLETAVADAGHVAAVAAADVVDAAAAPPAMPSVLCVDDEPHIQSALRRALRAADLVVHTAGSGEEALAVLASRPVDLVISDMRMPGMNGAQLLERVQQAHPDVVRVMLTGQADMSDTIDAINRGSVYRYLQKPWDDAELRHVVRQGLERRSLALDRQRLQALTRQQNEQLRGSNALLEQRVAERTVDLATAHDKLKRTYLTSIQVFSNLLELRGGRLVGHGRRVADTARRIGKAMACSEDEMQDLLIGGLLHDIGLIGLADHILNKPVARLADNDAALYRQHPVAGERSLLALEELQTVAVLIRAHHERFDGNGFPDGLAGAAIPLGARILAVADAFDDLQSGQLVDSVASVEEARALIRHGRGRQFDPEVVDVFLHITEPVRRKSRADLTLGSADLTPGMVLAADLLSGSGMLMLPAGQALDARLIKLIREFESRDGRSYVLKVHGPQSAQS